MNGFVYFIAAETVGAVKIGFSRNHPRARLKQLQTGCPAPLKLLAFIEGAPDDEAGLHKRFTDLKIHSEWFRLEGPLLHMVSRLPSPAEPSPDNRPTCPNCGIKAEAGHDHLTGFHNIKICRGLRHQEAAK